MKVKKVPGRIVLVVGEKPDYKYLELSDLVMSEDGLVQGAECSHGWYFRRRDDKYETLRRIGAPEFHSSAPRPLGVGLQLAVPDHVTLGYGDAARWAHKMHETLMRDSGELAPDDKYTCRFDVSAAEFED